MDSTKTALFEYCLRIGDSSLVLGHRVSEWCGHGPILEEDIALTNMALDLIGQSRNWLSYAAELENKGRTEDDLAYLRDDMDFRNALLTEQPNGDFALTITRQYLYSVFSYLLYLELSSVKDHMITGIAQKSLKEISYHTRHCSEWMLRLGDGTEESHQRMQNALAALWPFTDDLFETIPSDKPLIDQGLITDLSKIKSEWEQTVASHLKKATLVIPDNVFMISGSREGKHTEHLGHLLAEMQVLPRTYPGAKW